MTKCPSCGSSDIQLDVKTGLLHCNYCHREFAGLADTIDYDIATLTGINMGAGATDIVFDASDAITLKCTACGAEVVVDTNEAPQARCHWCRNMLSLNQQVPNGAVPDAVMPFRIAKDQARTLIEQFVGKRRFFAHPRFKAEFTTENIMGVYLPYMVIDVNAHAELWGEGEHETRRYTVKSGDTEETRYDADAYQVGRVFDLYIDDLTVEASSDKLEQTTSVNSNNVINAILPYPLKETLQFNANYLRGFTSEKRSVSRDQLVALVGAQVGDIARYHAWEQATFYDRGIRWDSENVSVKGELWKTVYLPVWLYSYFEQKSNGSKFLHYVAVNACSGKTMGSVPIHKPKLLAVSALVELAGIVLGLLIAIPFLLS
jgi:DNA-directed RNA polymerase subunit RPC12/RpoP